MVHVWRCKTQWPQRNLPVHLLQPMRARVRTGKGDVTRVAASASERASMSLRAGHWRSCVAPWGVCGSRADAGWCCEQDWRFFKTDADRVRGGRLALGQRVRSALPRAMQLLSRARCAGHSAQAYAQIGHRDGVSPMRFGDEGPLRGCHVRRDVERPRPPACNNRRDAAT